MDWFERLTGFREGSYREAKAKLSVLDGLLRCEGLERRYAVGTLTLPSLAQLRLMAREGNRPGQLRLSIVEGDVRSMHRRPENRDALFQVASQFNMLEMVAPSITPEQGVTRYEQDRTQGPACAMAAGAATIYRNYLVPVLDGTGQTSDKQLDGLGDLGAAFAQGLGIGVDKVWTMRNGYALPTEASLSAITAYLRDADAETVDGLRSLLRVGLHENVEVTDGDPPGPLVSQIFCSALPVAYSGLPTSSWTPFGRLILEAAYEATLLAGLLNAARTASNRVLLTRLGGGAFGNDDDWIDSAMLRAMRLVADQDLDVVIVSYGKAPQRLREFVQDAGFANDVIG